MGLYQLGLGQHDLSILKEWNMGWQFGMYWKNGMMMMMMEYDHPPTRRMSVVYFGHCHNVDKTMLQTTDLGMVNHQLFMVMTGGWFVVLHTLVDIEKSGRKLLQFRDYSKPLLFCDVHVWWILANSLVIIFDAGCPRHLHGVNVSWLQQWWSTPIDDRQNSRVRQKRNIYPLLIGFLGSWWKQGVDPLVFGCFPLQFADETMRWTNIVAQELFVLLFSVQARVKWSLLVAGYVDSPASQASQSSN